MYGSYKTHACIICGCTEFIDYTVKRLMKGITFDGKDAYISDIVKDDNPNLEACTGCGIVRDKRYSNKGEHVMRGEQ